MSSMCGELTLLVSTTGCGFSLQLSLNFFLMSNHKKTEPLNRSRFERERKKRWVLTFNLFHRMTASSGGNRKTTRANLTMFMMLIFSAVGEPVDSHRHAVPLALACVLHKENMTVPVQLYPNPNSYPDPHNHDPHFEPSL